MTEFRCELLSADQLALLANGPLPSGIAAGEARRSFHRDLYLDTTDDSLRRRGITCRLRITAEGRAVLTLRIAEAGERRITRVDAPVKASDPANALAAENAVARRVRGIIDPALLGVRVDLEVDRLTRRASLDWLRRPRLTVHLDRVTIRRNGTSAKFFQMCAHHLHGKPDELRLLEEGLEELHGVRPSAVPTHERAELAIKWARLEDLPRPAGYSDRLYRVPVATSATAEFINPELSLLAFQRRVLALADDERTPLRERLRFLAIVAANVDEFFMVRMVSLLGAARDASAESVDDGLTPDEELAAVDQSVAGIMAHQASSFAECRTALAAHGVHLRTWSRLSTVQREALRDRFRDDVLPLLTPMAMTLSPGHPLPRLGHLTLSVALILRSRSGGPPRFAELELPPSLPRFFVAADGSERVVVPVEEMIRGNLDTLYPEMQVEHAYMFRVTRSAELELDEEHADDLLDEVARASATRGQGSAVRLEVERGMPAILRALLLENVRREQVAAGAPVLADVEEIDGPVDLRGLTQLSLPDDPALGYPPLEPRRPFAESANVFETIARGDVLVHHPFDSFSDTVVRFIREASADVDVQAIKITLYRVGEPSPIVDALIEAARRGKSVTAFVELKARFDEAVNVGLARALEAAGGHVVRGIVGLKNHAKVTLVVRREGAAARRYVHIGTGNYNTRSGEQYTDLSLFTTDGDLTSDVADLFNELTGASEAPRHPSRRLLIAPHHLLPGMLALIDREAAHARAGRPARITAKFNGLSDPDAVRALYRASADGVEIDLIVRGICTLRPGVPGLSDRIRVVSIVGRFLEHSRIYRFENGGDPRYYIGSADLRPRNLRRRVELLAPIANAEHRAVLDRVLSLYVNDQSGWELRGDGSYAKRAGVGLPAQAVLGASDSAARSLAESGRR
ncbi:MAG TPA: polyphosphate kinase 1 [Gemmatimonadaceae bacterium]|jgi:polyphosphate kinase|nr:polyphosphate kinase 1 [Gemmatimonadaceae bacterium]